MRALQHPELEGLCRSPFDDPPKWAFMLTMCIDESLDQVSGMCIVGGFLGKRKHWRPLLTAWDEAKKPFSEIHLAEMRLGSATGEKRYKDVLSRLGPIPAQCGLVPIVGSICRADYIDRVRGTVSEDIMTPYVLGIIAMLDAMVRHLPKNERVELIFERQEIYEAQRSRAVTLWNGLDNHRTYDGRERVAKASSVSKGTMTESADYLCYALHQRDKDKTSQKARLTASILDSQRYTRNHVTKEQVNHWIDHAESCGNRPFRTSTQRHRNLVRGRSTKPSVRMVTP